jgi:hypothetical protein
MRNNKLGKVFGPVQIYMGYVFIACGILCASYSFTSLFLIIPGAFMAFTSTGTIVDTDNKRVKPYTLFFGIMRTGKWIDAGQFTRFSIKKVTKNHTSYSRGSVRLDMDQSEIRLLLINSDNTKNVVLNKFCKFEEAQLEMKELEALISS